MTDPTEDVVATLALPLTVAGMIAVLDQLQDEWPADLLLVDLVIPDDDAVGDRVQLGLYRRVA